MQVQIWNKSCYSCHVSQQEKNFDPEKNAYKTAWLDFGINCERCHGPGSEHVAHLLQRRAAHGACARYGPADAPRRARNTMVCAQCHSFRDIYVQGFAAGDDYYDYFMPMLEYNLPDERAIRPTGPTAARGASPTTPSGCGRANAI